MKYESTVKGMKDPIIDYKQMAEDLQSEVDRLKELIDLMQCHATINRVLIDDDDFDLEDILELIKTKK